MHLPNRSGCEGLYVELSKSLLPVWTKIECKCLFYLLLWHNMSFFSCLLKGFPDWGWDKIVLLDAEHLGYFQRSSSHFTELLGNLMCSSFVYLLLASSSEATSKEGFNFNTNKLPSKFSIFPKSPKSTRNHFTFCSFEVRLISTPLFGNFELDTLWSYLLFQCFLLGYGLCCRFTCISRLV